MLIDPKPISILLPDGGEKTYIISKFPAIQGREIIAAYPLSSLPKLGDYKRNEEIMYMAMKYVAIDLPGGNQQPLITPELINNHIKSWETLARIEIALLEYNCSFFQNGRISSFFEDIAQKVPVWITEIFTQCLAQLSNTEKPLSENSTPSTP